MASTPFWFTAAGDGQGGTNSTIPIPTPGVNSPNIPSGSDASSMGMSTIDFTSFFNLFGMNTSNTPAVPPNTSNPGTSGFIGGLQQWVTQNPGAALLFGILLVVMTTNVSGGSGRR